jgi:hypothetical protein
LKLSAHVAAHSARERAMEDSWQLLPLELAALSEACSGIAPLQAVLDIEDRCFVLLAKREPRGRLGLEVFERELHRAAKGHRLVQHPPSSVARRLDRMDLATPARIVERIGDEGPDRLGRARDLDGLLDADEKTLDAYRRAAEQEGPALVIALDDEEASGSASPALFLLCEKDIPRSRTRNGTKGRFVPFQFAVPAPATSGGFRVVKPFAPPWRERPPARKTGGPAISGLSRLPMHSRIWLYQAKCDLNGSDGTRTRDLRRDSCVASRAGIPHHKRGSAVPGKHEMTARLCESMRGLHLVPAQEVLLGRFGRGA